MEARECCQQYSVFPKDVNCFVKGLARHAHQLKCRHKCLDTSRHRLRALSKPKSYQERYIRKCPCRFRIPIEIIRLETPIYTRTEQLAYPYARKLLLFKDSVKKLYEPKRMEIVNRLIRKSLFSIYSRLGNVQPPVEQKPIHKWDKKEWREHTKYLKKLSKPKKGSPQPKVPKLAMDYKAMRRYKKLAKPKLFVEELKEEWIFTPEMRFFEPTQRLIKLAVPKAYPKLTYNKLPIPISDSAKRYKASKRIQELSEPKEKRVGESDEKENPFLIPPNALKAKASKRIIELAEPKEYENTHIRDDPFAISPAALKAKCSPRLAELAKPRER